MKRIFLGLAIATLLLTAGASLARQNSQPAGTVQTFPGQSQYYLTPISATAAVNTATTLTIPAPAAGLTNYICSLSFEVGNDNTGTAVSNVVTTSTNFNSFAIKFSQPATASIDSFVPVFNATPASGCIKSAAAATATTFVSPSGVTHGAWTWYATYYQAP